MKILKNSKFKIQNLKLGGWVVVFLLLQGAVRAQSPTPTETAAVVPQRVISMAPNITEMIYDMGASGQLVGVTDYCCFPLVARLKPKVGGWLNPNYEKIL